ncbi:MAG: hypothetical protein R2788_07955 [Saprospiraceae bacterium]
MTSSSTCTVLGRSANYWNCHQSFDLQKSLNALFPNLHESYSISMDLSSKPVRFAKRQEGGGFQPKCG